jgi:predicted ATPase
LTEGLRSDAVIRTPDQRLRVFVSSTLGELAEERQAVSRAISTLRLTPVMFELGARPHPPRELYRAYLEQSDVFIGLYWQSYGRVSPGMEVSGLAEEFDLSRALPRLVYVKAPAPEREPRLTDLLSRIKEADSYRTFRTPNELGRLVRDDLAALLSERFAASVGPAAISRPSPAAGVIRPLPLATTTLFGRERAIDEVVSLVGSSDGRLVTLTGPGGVGKTRLAIAVGERLRGRFGSGIVFVSLEAVAQPEQVVTTIGRAMGVQVARIGSGLDGLVERLGDASWLLILDNMEQLLEAARDLDELLVRCPGSKILATSRTALRLRAEREYAVAPLPLPVDLTTLTVDELASSPAVALFVDRARAVRSDFVLTPRRTLAVAEICRRLEGLPLAIELAAARIRLLDPDALSHRLERSLDALGKGSSVDTPDRQQTLRATVEWSVDLLDDAERSFLEVMAVFVDGWTIEAAAQVAGLDDDRALELTEALARQSLVYVDVGDLGPRPRMLATIRAFVGEQLAARPDFVEIQHRHADYCRTLAEAADRPLRGLGQSAWADRLQAETGNFTAAVRWYLAHDRAPLPHLFRVLSTFWALRNRVDDARSWVDELLPTADSLSPQPRAELLWTASIVALDAGDDAAARAACERLAALLDGISEPFLRAVSQLVLAWSSPITGDFDGALRRALDSLRQLRSQDEPVWTALAVGTAGTLELGTGNYDDALGHLTEVRDLAAQFDIAFLAAWSGAALGILAVIQARFDDAWALLDEGLSLSLVAHSQQVMTLCLSAFARLAFAEVKPERAARLVGAAEGLRQRARVRTWPVLRRLESEFVAQIRAALGKDRFEEVFGAGFTLSQRDAVAEVRARLRAGTPEKSAGGGRT